MGLLPQSSNTGTHTHTKITKGLFNIILEFELLVTSILFPVSHYHGFKLWTFQVNRESYQCFSSLETGGGGSEL